MSMIVQDIEGCDGSHIPPFAQCVYTMMCMVDKYVDFRTERYSRPTLTPCIPAI